MRTLVGSFLLDLRNRGAEVRVEGNSLVVEAPQGVLTSEDRKALATTKPLLLERLAIESRLLEMSIEEFEADGCAIEVKVPWLDQTLWWVPRIEHVADLVEHNVQRGRIYTAKELTNLTTVLLSGSGGPDLPGIAALKLAFNATIITAGAGEKEKHPAQPTPASSAQCSCSRQGRSWRSIHGVVTCATCHPPAAPELVAAWLDEAVPTSSTNHD